MMKPSLRGDPYRYIHIFPAGQADPLTQKTADRMRGTEPSDWTYLMLPPGAPPRPVARVVPVAGNELLYAEAVDLTLERVRVTRELGDDPLAIGADRIVATRGETVVEHEVRIIEILLN